MANVRDIHNFGAQFDYQLEKLDEADMDERDREAIKDFVRYQDTQHGLAPSMNINNWSDLRLSIEHAVAPQANIPRR